MRKNLLILTVFAYLSMSCVQYKYETVEGDLMQTRIYTLDNGLKVYMSVNKDQPRIQTAIAVKAGSIHDPVESTGLAHYFEHLMFKGTKKTGALDYEKEEPLLAEIEELYEKYRKIKDENQRKIIYRQIDSLSQEAALYAASDEYTKLMRTLGSNRSSAYTTNDYTAYEENIPSYQFENWARIQADRFENPVVRSFHTELETVYEEYNKYQIADRKYAAIRSGLFPHHPYGKPVIGFPEHIKNPSIKNIKTFFDSYYRPNNMAICLCGDLDPEQTIKIIDKYFGVLKRKDIPKIKIQLEEPMYSPVVKNIEGENDESVTIAYRLPGGNTEESAIFEIVDRIISHNINLNLIQKNKILEGVCNTNICKDYCVWMLEGRPNEGQSLDDVYSLLMKQIEILKKGEFSEDILEATINNLRKSRYAQQEKPTSVTELYILAFTTEIDWEKDVKMIDFLSKLTKNDIMNFCNKHINDNHVIVYERPDKLEIKTIEKPEITPITNNDDKESDFYKEIISQKIIHPEPVFIDFSTDFSKLKTRNGIEVLYKHNKDNPLFSMEYDFDMGLINDKALGTASYYWEHLGTPNRSAEEFYNEQYKSACYYKIIPQESRFRIIVSGLSDNCEKTLTSLEERLDNAVVDTNIWHNVVADILETREQYKNDTDFITHFFMIYYVQWGIETPYRWKLYETELKLINPQSLIDKIKSLKNFKHRIIYYGPLKEQEIIDIIDKVHIVPKQFNPVPDEKQFVRKETNENKVYLLHYNNLPRSIFGILSKGHEQFEKELEPYCTLYHEYLYAIYREKLVEETGLVYDDFWINYYYESMFKQNQSYYFISYASSQTNKIEDVSKIIHEIIENFPESEKTFNAVKNQILADMRVTRITRNNIFEHYIDAKRLGYDYDPRKDIFEKVPNISLSDIKLFHEKYVKNKPVSYYIIADTTKLDKNFPVSLGQVHKVTQEEIFGY
jgi:predicted Zn-dependent peptidase